MEKKCENKKLAVSMIADVPNVPVKCEESGEHTEHTSGKLNWKNKAKPIK